MKLLFALIFLSSLAEATEPTLESLVANDLQALVSDTVNEGEQTAYVVKTGKKPKVTCKLGPVANDPSKKWAFCKVYFKVSYEDLKTERSCSVLYSFSPSTPAQTLRRENEDLFTNCIESLGESIE